SVLPADRRTLWNPGVTYAGGGIPARTDVCASLRPSGGDDTQAIQAALDGCGREQVVQLSAGTFNVTGDGLNFRTSHVTLRGAGSGTPGTGEGGTRLVKADYETNPNSALIYLGHDAGKFASSTRLAADGV